MKRFLLFLVLMTGAIACLLTHSVSAQTTAPASLTVKGKVVLSKENTGLGNVSVQASKSKVGTTVTADDGSFTIRIEKGESLRFTRVDLQPVTITAVS